MSKVFVLDADWRPLMPCTPARARLLLKQQKAAVLRHYPFTLILKKAKPETRLTPLRLKIDPGAKTSGLALINDAAGEVIWAAEITHRGEQVHDELTTRRSVRHSRRSRHTRYRKPRWRNRRRRKGWLAPSLRSRVHNVLSWVQRLCKRCPIGAISLELVRFDLALLQNPELEGLEYQRGTLFARSFASICSRNGSTGAPTVVSQASRSKSTIYSLIPKEEVTGSPTWS